MTRNSLFLAVLVAIPLLARCSDPGAGGGNGPADAAGGDTTSDTDDGSGDDTVSVIDTGNDADAPDVDDVDETDVDASEIDASDSGSDDILPDTSDGEPGAPCLEDADCASGLCATIDPATGAGLCSNVCVGASDCPDGFACVSLYPDDPDQLAVCIPTNVCIDADEDGFGVGASCLGPDCDDDAFTVHVGADEICDNADNDCDLEVDEFTVDSNRECETGFFGVCAEGRTVCEDGIIDCVQEELPSIERCDLLDNDCDGEIDEAEADRTLPLTAPCYSGPLGTSGVGICTPGVQTCLGGEYRGCEGMVLPGIESCNGLDDDCNGRTDENDPGAGILCDTGLSGICARGIATCLDGELACIADVAGETEVCDGTDNDCDGTIDAGDDGEPLDRSCYDGPEGTVGVGVCVAGTQSCSDGEYRDCTGDVIPTAEVCDGLDNDCDGDVDEDNPGGGLRCNSGFPGVCTAGETVCRDGDVYCLPDVTPSAEVCDGLDNDCDGRTDEDLRNQPLSRSCYAGPAGTSTVGVCQAGKETCAEGRYGACVGQVIPGTEVCNGEDDNCNGRTDENNPGGGQFCSTGLQGPCELGRTFCLAGELVCDGLEDPEPERCDGDDNDCDGLTDEGTNGQPLTRTCYDGPAGTSGIGICSLGTEACEFGEWQSCLGDVMPTSETCDGEDDDCDNIVDEGNPGGGAACSTGLGGVCATGNFQCSGGRLQCRTSTFGNPEACNSIDDNCDGLVDNNPDGSTLSRSCYDGDPAKIGIGVCRAGVELCIGNEYGSCEGDVLPSAEVCDGLDNDCDGTPDDGAPGAGQACATGLPGACGVGTTRCEGGTLSCVPNSVGTETCDGIDNDCDGRIDEDLVRTCYDGAVGTAGQGACRAGSQTCGGGDWGTCVGQVIPTTEVCDFADNDCDGQTDEGLTTLLFRDADQDGFGDPASRQPACLGLSGWVENGDDCYDSNRLVNPLQVGFFSSHRGDFSFDYNCDSSSELEYPYSGDYDCEFTGCEYSEGWSGRVPSCGQGGSWLTACAGLVWICTDVEYDSRTQRCR